MKRIIHILLVIMSVQCYAQTSEVRDITPIGFSGDFEKVVYGKGNGFIALGSNNYMYTSYDTCKTWSIERTPVEDAKGMIMHDDGFTGYMYNTYKMYKTIDGGKTWSIDDTEGIPEELNGRTMEYRKLFIKNSDTLFFVTSNRENGLRIYMSSDEGATWNMQAEKLYSSSISNTISSLAFVTPLHGYAFANGYYAETTDGGVTWQKQLMNQYETQFYVSVQVDENTIIQSYSTPSESMPDLEGVIWYRAGIDKFVNVNGKVLGVWNDNLHITTDTAQTWQFNSLNKYCNDICFINDTVGVLVGKELTSFITTDGGETWNKYVHGGAEGFNNLYCKSETECFITGSTGRLFRTQDGGDTWTWEDIHNTGLREIEFPTVDTGYIAGNNVLFMTIDGGDTWEKKATTINGSLIEFPNSKIGYIGYVNGSTTIKKTIDAGDSWTDPIDINYYYNSEYGKKFSFRSVEEGVICGTENLLIHTVDGGVNWDIIDSIPITYNKISQVVSVSDKGWLIEAKSTGLSEIFYCDNDFNCTVTLGNKDMSGFLQAVNDSVYYISIDTTEFISIDYGITWEDLEIDLLGIVSVPSPHVAYSFYDYELKIYKAYINVSEISLSVIQNSNRNYSLTPTFLDNTLEVTVYVRDSQGTLHEVAQNVTLQNGVAYILEIPQDIPTGSYSIYIEPQSSAYAPVESDIFDVGTGLQDIRPFGSAQGAECFKLQGNILHIKNTPIHIYNIMGIELPVTGTSIQLNAGVYVLETKCGTEKIMIND